MRGVVVQVNRSPGGIPKTPVQEVFVSKRGVDGDDWAHPKYHGGPKQALLLISTEALAELGQIGFVLQPGDLGENLTVTGLDHKQWRAGQSFRAGDVELQLTKPRTPCRTLDVFGKGIQKALKEDLRGGFYASVTKAGTL